MSDSLRPHGPHTSLSVHGIFQARVLEWVAISFSRGSSWPRDQTRASHIAGRRFTVWASREACVQLFCNPMDGSPLGSSVRRIPQARILEWVAISFSKVSSQPRDWTQASCTGRWVLYHWATREVIWFQYWHLVMSMCRAVSCTVGKGCFLWPACSFNKTLLAFTLLRLPNLPVIPGISWLLTFAFQSPVMKRTSIFLVLVLEGLVGHHRTVYLQLLRH